MKNIVVLHGEEEGQEIFRDALSSSSYNIMFFGDSNEAFEYISRRHNHSTATDIMILEARGENSPAFNLTKKLYREGAFVPAIAFSDKPDSKTVIEAMRAGFTDFLETPLTGENIKAAIARISSDSKIQTIVASRYLNKTRKIVVQRTVGNYRLLKVIGEGANGIVYLCQDVDSGLIYAMKMLRMKVRGNDDSEKQSAIENFINESTAISQINHPNIINFIEFGYRRSGKRATPYIVMEYFKGKSLSYYIDNPDEITLYEKVRIIRQLAQALSAVHSKNILHRDIKPENILLSEALQVKVTDFGVCHLPTSAQMGFAEGIFGTPRYIAPEYFRKGRIDQRGDIYSLGVVAYELLLGTKPFAGLTLKELVRKTLKEYPEEPVKIDSEFPLPLQGILAKMLKKKPKRRYYEASEIIRDIDALCHKNSSALSFDALINVLERDWA